MVHTKKAAKIAKYKKHKKLPFDATPWEELSKDIKGKFKSKIETQDEDLLASESNINYKKIDELNCQETNNNQSKKVFAKGVDEIKCEKEKKLEILLGTSPGDSNHIKVTHDHKNHESNISQKSSSVENNDCESSNINSQKLLPVHQLSKYEKKKLKRQKKKISDLSSPISGEKSNVPVKAKVQKLSLKKKLERKKLFEKKRFERRKELGIMLLPKNFENRLLRIRKALRKKKLPTEEIKSIMRAERSKAQDEFRKSHSAQICFNCRKPGHLVANCPSNEENKDSSICLKCGSTEHKYAACTKKITGFPFATCFICKGQGHISRDCPNNEHGIYPKGGKCSLCDSINHLRKNCPTLKPKKESSITLHTIDNGTSVDDEVMDIEPSTKKLKSEKPKVVTF